MGQYYIIANFDKKEYFTPKHGIKLMEWSYNRNDTVLELIKLINSNWKGCRVNVIGDYAQSNQELYDSKFLEEIEKEFDIYGKKSPEGYDLSIYSYIKDNFKLIKYEDFKISDPIYKYRYIYNHKTKEYVDMYKSSVQWCFIDTKKLLKKLEKHTIEDLLKNDFNDLKKIVKNKYVFVKISPLSLMLACGNGLGGGDYHYDNEYIGYWIDSSQYLEITKKLLDLDYEEIVPDFNEQNFKAIEGDKTKENKALLDKLIYEAIETNLKYN